ncbi:MAG: PD-(D/E)XK nuclease family protein [Chitinophagales bacterium]
MKKFLEMAASQILNTHGNNLSEVTVLMPNQRSCTYFNNELQNLATHTIFAPEIETLQNWLLAKSNLSVVDNLELVAELYRCHQDIGGELSLDDFIGTANILLADFDELDMQMVDPKSFFKNLELLQSMKTYEPGEQPGENALLYRKFWSDFGKLYNLLRKRLFALNKGYRGMILRDVAERLSNLELDNKLVYLIGFSGLNKLDEVVISHLKQNAVTCLIWNADTYYVKDEMNEAGLFFRKYKSQFNIDDSCFINEISTAQKRIKAIGAAKNVGQVKVVADILQNKLQLDEEDLRNTVVVIPDEKLLSPLIANLPSNVTALNVTMGLTIAGSNPATFFEVLFRLYLNSEKYKSKNRGQRFYYKDIFELLQHSYCRLLFGSLNPEQFIETMKLQNRILIRYEELTKAFTGKLDPVLFEGESAELYAEYLLQVVSMLLDKLVQLARDGNTALATDTEIVFRLRSIVSNSSSVFKAGESVSIKTFIALLRENFRNERVALEGDPVQGLQIMGLQETRSLDFKNVIILSANEGILPSGKNTRSYIPYELRKEFLSTYKEKDAITAYLFYRLFQQAENVFILYNTEPDELGGGEKSRFILQLQQELVQVNRLAEVTDMIFAIDPPAAVRETEIVIEKCSTVMQKIETILTGSGLSPSALNTYINCPLQYYFRYIAGLKEEDEIEESMDAATIGSAVHYALEIVFEQKLNAVVDQAFLESKTRDKNLIEGLIREHLAKRFDQESLSSGKNLLLFKVCIKLTEEFLKHQLYNLQQLNDSGEDMRIEMLEGKIEHTILMNNKVIKIAGRVDRIESVGGIIQIADYKTSRKSIIPILTEETWDTLTTDPKYAKSVQLLVYAWLYNRMRGVYVPVRSGIYWLREKDKNLDTVRLTKTEDVLDADSIQKFEEKLRNVLSDMLNPEISFTKTIDKERCEFCDFKNICERN